MTAAAVALLLGFAVVTHLVAVGSLAVHAPFRAALAVFVPPLAPYWCWQRAMKRRALVWCVAVVVYALVLAVAER